METNYQHLKRAEMQMFKYLFELWYIFEIIFFHFLLFSEKVLFLEKIFLIHFRFARNV